jgi:hypothetical protein
MINLKRDMLIEKLKDGSSKISYENGDYFFVEKGKDPIDGVIDIAMKQKKTETAICNNAPAKGILKPELFFVTLSAEYNIEACLSTHKKSRYNYLIGEYNREIRIQQLKREMGESDTDNQVVEGDQANNREISGKYLINNENNVPEFSMRVSETPMNFPESVFIIKITETQKQLQERFVARSLLNYIFCRSDIRKIETRISEIKGLCAYLKMMAPDEYTAYCVLADRIGFNARLDTERYYDILRMME